MIKLNRMTQKEFDQFLPEGIQHYAADLHSSGSISSLAQAHERAVKDYQRFLPAGVATPDNHLFHIHDTAQQQNVGVLWFAEIEREGSKYAFVYELLIFEHFRRRGYASQAFKLLESEVQALNLTAIFLNVFGNNTAAQALYQSLGYITTSMTMSKKLEQ